MRKSSPGNIPDLRKRILSWIAPLLIVLGVISLLFSLHKEITLVVNGKPETKTTFALTVGGFLRQQNVTVSEDDTLHPPVNRFLWGDEQITLQRASQVTVISDQNTTHLVTTERKPANILAGLEIPLYPKDQIFIDGELLDPDAPVPYQPHYTIRVKRATPVTIYTEEGVETFTTRAETIAEALRDADIPLYEEDDITPSPQTPLTGEPLQIEVTRAEPLQITLPEETINIRTTAETVGPAIYDAGLTLQGLDYTKPDETDPIPEDRNIEIVRVEEKVILEQKPIDFSTKFQPVSDLELDQRTIVEGGKYGLKASRVRVIFENGEEVSRTKEKEWTAKEPQPRVIGYGTKVVVKTTNTPDGPINYWRAVPAFATSYSPCRSGVEDCYYKTYSGKPVKKGVVAVVRSWYQYMAGMRVYIKGYGFATIEDIGGGVPGQYWVDLGYSDANYVPWNENVTVYFLAPKPPPEKIMYVLH